MTVVNGRHPFQLSIEARGLIDFLHTITHHELIPYAELNKRAGTNVREHRACLSTARRAMVREGKVFEVVPKEGLRLLTDEDRVKLAVSDTARIRRGARRSTQRLLTVDREKLHDKRGFDVALTIMSIFDRVTRPATVRKLEGAVTQAQARLNVAETLRLFASGGPED